MNLTTKMTTPVILKPKTEIHKIIKKGFEFFYDWSFAKLEANHELIRRNLRDKKPLFRHIVPPSVFEMYDGVIDLNNREFGVYGARKVTKTFTSTLGLFDIALRIPGFRWIHAFPSLTTGRETCFDIWWQIYPLLPPELRPRIFKSYNLLVLPNKSIIKVMGADPDSLNNRRSGRADGLLMDEICFWDSDAFDNAVNGIFIPMTSASKYRLNRFATTVADDPNHPSLTTVLPRLEAIGKWLVFDIYKSPFYTEEFRQEKIKECGGETSLQYRREYLCELIADEIKKIILNFDEKRHVVECFDPQPFITGDQFNRDGGIIVDSAGDGVNSDLMGMIGWRYDHDRDKVCIIAEWLGKKVDLEQMYREMSIILEQIKQVKVKREVIDCFNEIAIEIRKSGRSFTTASGYKTEVTKQTMAVDTSFYLNKIEIDPRCVKLINQIKKGLWKITENKKTFSKTRELGHLDLLSCLCYLQRVVRWGQVPVDKLEWDLCGTSDCENNLDSESDIVEIFYEHMKMSGDNANVIAS